MKEPYAEIIAPVTTLDASRIGAAAATAFIYINDHAHATYEAVSTATTHAPSAVTALTWIRPR